jgi:hypothetical protein
MLCLFEIRVEERRGPGDRGERAPTSRSLEIYEMDDWRLEGDGLFAEVNELLELDGTLAETVSKLEYKGAVEGPGDGGVRFPSIRWRGRGPVEMNNERRFDVGFESGASGEDEGELMVGVVKTVVDG